MKSHLLYFILLLVIVSCAEEEIKWKTTEIPPRLVVEGAITNELKIHKVRLTSTDDYFANIPAKGILDATVTISDGLITYNLIENPDSAGLYETEVEIQGEIGKTYTLTVDLQYPINNETHYTASAFLKETIQINSMQSFLYENPISYDEVDTTIIVLLIEGYEPVGENDHYLINIYKNDSLVTDTIDEVTILNDIEWGIEGEQYFGFLFFGQYAVGDSVELEICSISKGYYDFINAVIQIKTGPDPFGFSGPSANATGNIGGGEALGFFNASAIVKKKGIIQYYE